MNKRWMWFLLYGVYVILLAALIVLQYTAVQDDLLRLLANVLALLLACPVMLLVFTGRVDSEQMISKKQTCTEKEMKSEDQKEYQLPDLQTEPKIRTMEEFCSWTKQWNLSAREQEVGWLIYKGYTNRQIAQELYIAETTVKKHAGHIYEKTGVSGRKEFSALLTLPICREDDGYDSIRNI